MQNTIFFVHRGSTDVARYAALQAVSIGLDVHVIGEESWHEIPYITFHNIEKIASSCERFRSIYRHVSMNDIVYERFCFERWFLILEVARSLRLTKFYYADSDMLVFPKAFDLDLEARFLMFDTAWFNYFKSVEVLSDFCEYLISIYENDTYLEFSKKYAIDSVPHLSDMHCFFEYGLSKFTLIAPLAALGPFLGYNERFSMIEGFAGSQLSPNVQQIYRTETGLSVAYKYSGQKINLRTVHFQGRTKPFIQAFHQISDKSMLRYLVDLSNWYVNNNLISEPQSRGLHEYLQYELNYMKKIPVPALFSGKTSGSNELDAEDHRLSRDEVLNILLSDRETKNAIIDRVFARNKDLLETIDELNGHITLLKIEVKTLKDFAELL